MGLGTSRNDATFVKIVKGLGLVVRVKEGTEGANERQLKNGETVHELVFDTLSGYIQEIKTRDVTFNDKSMKFWAVTITDHGSTYILSMPYSSRYSSSFLKRLPNLDLKAEVTIHCAHFADDDRTVLWLTQEGVKVEQAYTKEDPNGLPEMKQVKVKGELVWDDSEMMDYLEAMVEKDIKPKLAELNQVESLGAPDDDEDVANDAQTATATKMDKDEDDLPF